MAVHLTWEEPFPLWASVSCWGFYGHHQGDHLGSRFSLFKKHFLSPLCPLWLPCLVGIPRPVLYIRRQNMGVEGE